MAAKSPEMDQEMAQKMFTEGATLVMLDVPAGTEFGIDYNSWTVGTKFKGVKMIPPGCHFVYYSAVNKEGQPAPRTGFFHNFSQREILLKKWDMRLEDFPSDNASSEDVERVAANKMELDRFLGVYPYDSYKKWVSLTSHVTPAVLSKLNPTCGKISAVTEFESKMSTSQSRREDATRSTNTDTPPGESKLPELKIVEGTEIRFSLIDRHKFPEGATASDISKYSVDSSYFLQRLIDLNYAEEPLGVLGELQFAFVTFLIGQVYDGFEQWKKLASLLCSCDEALGKHTELFSQFINVLHHQIKEIPEDFFVDIVTQNNFLTSTLQRLFQNLEENEEVDGALKRRGKKFCEHLEKKFKWDFTTEPDDEAPVIVE